ncbi:MAG: hypothetical protein JG774_162 [Desulfomicrobiaceae bacterium]|nr:hypothetical protein [Desulfomicrobiaceae bacterium]MBZ4648435.1 hypothetical protein [Desulfomicrobiaceae bacterium]MBZ4684417.1 hypothetical protein [Desulfomicrobiaceae bacterium]MDI3493441.1 hypothetical protein [Desulfomicrobiaceae bacterium]HCF05975.1 hypothetical protein [Desulfomicrobiaceae bacterium]
MPPKIRPGYPMPFSSHHGRKVGIAVDTHMAEEGRVQVVYLDAAFKARLGWLRWQDAGWSWDEADLDGPSAEDRPELESYVFTVKNGRYG